MLILTNHINRPGKRVLLFHQSFHFFVIHILQFQLITGQLFRLSPALRERQRIAQDLALNLLLHLIHRQPRAVQSIDHSPWKKMRTIIIADSKIHAHCRQDQRSGNAHGNFLSLAHFLHLYTPFLIRNRCLPLAASPAASPAHSCEHSAAKP